MLTPDRAYSMLRLSGSRGMDDPTEAALPVRWYFNYRGELARAYWRDTSPATWPQYREPRWIDERELELEHRRDARRRADRADAGALLTLALLCLLALLLLLLAVVGRG